MRFAIGRDDGHAAVGCKCSGLVSEPALTDTWRSNHIDHGSNAADRLIEERCDGVDLPRTTDERRRVALDMFAFHRCRDQPVRGNPLFHSLNAHHLGLTQHRRVLDQSCSGLAQHHSTGRGDRFHPLRHPYVLADGGITRRARTDITGDHLTGVQTDAQLQCNATAALEFTRESLCLTLNALSRKTRAERVIFQCHWRTEQRHDSVAGELVHRPAVALHHSRRTFDQLRHDFPQPLRPNRRSDIHRMHDVGEQHRHLLVLGWPRFAGNRRAARVTEPCILQWLGAARPAHGGCRHGVRIG